MSTATHSPFPWKIGEWENYNNEDVLSIFDANGNLVAGMLPIPIDKGIRQDCEQAEANAKLMVSIPALKEIERLAKKFLDDAQFIPPWESAGAVWYEKLKPLANAVVEYERKEQPHE